MEFSTRYRLDFEYVLSEVDIKQFEGSTWFITGASGFIMTYFVKFLLYANTNCFQKKSKLYLLCRSREKMLKKLGLSEETSEIEIIEQDVNDSLRLEAEVDYVILGASISATRLFTSNPVEVITANTVGLNNVLSCLKNKKVKSILFMSSGAVYGEISDSIEQLRETDYFPLDFVDIRNCYAQSKRLGELLMTSYYAEYSLPCRSIRISHTYGPGIDLNDGHVYSDFVRSIINHQDLVIYGDGMAVRPFCYVADAVLAFLMILSRGNDGESYNMANNHSTYSVYELAVLLAAEITNNQIKVDRRQKPKSKPERHLVNTSKLEELGWQPQIGVVEGFRRTIESFEEEMMRKILITGGNGFIGKNLVESLSDNYQIYAPSSQELDLRDIEKTSQYLEKQSFDTVIHCANTNNTRHERGGVSNYQILHDNLIMYWSIARCEQLYNKMYYFGSGTEFDMEHYMDNMSEEYFDTYIPQDAYGFSKYIMNQNARKSSKIFNLRLFGVYGRYEEWNRRFISNNICRILRGLNISINQDVQFDYLYVQDLCRIMVWFIENIPKYHDYNICTGVNIKLSDIAVVLQKICGSELPIRVKCEGEKSPYTANNTRLLKEVGEWRFTDLVLGIEEMWDYYRLEYQTNIDFRNKVDSFEFG